MDGEEHEVKGVESVSTASSRSGASKHMPAQAPPSLLPSPRRQAERQRTAMLVSPDTANASLSHHRERRTKNWPSGAVRRGMRTRHRKMRTLASQSSVVNNERAIDEIVKMSSKSAADERGRNVMMVNRMRPPLNNTTLRASMWAAIAKYYG
eukprot:TRINITY_DN835_c0_g1_i14.p1 TRINITY_DN835_c0_g1~~TRINITY_DN835_c0_g1_i14.p1  ORF type:complete len:152 (-),score=27.62 TRINITY_DN835_c0_g1_i14:160-615(-)